MLLSLKSNSYHDYDDRPIVCQVLHSMDVGGTEILAMRLAQRLCNRFKFYFICLDRIGALGKLLQNDGFLTATLCRRPGMDLACAYRLGQVLRKLRVDIVHAHQYGPFVYSALARNLLRKASLLFTEHGRHYPDYPRKKRMIFNRMFLRKNDQVIGVGEAVKRALINNEGLPSDQTKVLYNGIDLSPYTFRPEDRSNTRIECGWHPHEFIVIQVARLDYLKDHGTALQIYRQLLLTHAAAKLVFVGDGPELNAVNSMIKQYHLQGKVELLGTRNDVPRLLRAADAFLLTSISEGIPLTLIEAMAASLPVVATNVGGVSEVVVAGQTGYLAQAKDVDSLATYLEKLAGNYGLRRHMGQCGRSRALRLFTEDKMIAQYHSLYDELLRMKSSRRINVA